MNSFYLLFRTFILERDTMAYGPNLPLWRTILLSTYFLYSLPSQLQAQSKSDVEVRLSSFSERGCMHIALYSAPSMLNKSWCCESVVGWSSSPFSHSACVNFCIPHRYATCCYYWATAYPTTGGAGSRLVKFGCIHVCESVFTVYIRCMHANVSVDIRPTLVFTSLTKRRAFLHI